MEKNEINKFNSENNSITEKYDFIVSISKKTYSEISSFVKELCDLDKHYLRP